MQPSNITQRTKESNIDGDEQWSEIIRPKSGMFNLMLGEVWRYRDLLILFVKRDFTAKYKQTILGPLWHILQPALTTLMSVLLYNVVAGIETDGQNKVLFQMSGIVMWAYFSTCITATSTTFVTNASIFGKVYFPRLVSPLSVILSNIIQFGIQFGLLVVTILFFLIRGGQQHFGISWLLIPVVVFLVGGISLGLGIIISSLTTKYRDLSVLITFGVQLLMFASAVNIPLSKYVEKGANYPWILAFVKWNPLATLIDTFRNAVLGGSINYPMLAYCFVFMMVSLLLGAVVFNKVEKTFMDTV